MGDLRTGKVAFNKKCKKNSAEYQGRIQGLKYLNVE